MQIDKATGATRLLYLLFKLRLLSEKRYLKLIDYLTIRSLTYQMKEKRSDKTSN